MQEILLKVYFKRGLSKGFKKGKFFLLNPVPFSRQNYKKTEEAWS